MTRNTTAVIVQPIGTTSEDDSSPRRLTWELGGGGRHPAAPKLVVTSREGVQTVGKWFASAKGQDTGNEYVYEIDGPTGASISEVTNAALVAHGQNVLDGTVNEVIDPIVTVTEVKP